MDPSITTGEPHSLFPPPLQAGAFWPWWGPGLDLVIAGHDLASEVVDAFGVGDLGFALVDEPPAVWLLFAFDPVISTHAVPFNVHQLPEHMRPVLTSFTHPRQTFRGIVRVLEAETSVVLALRSLLLAPEFSRKLAALVQAQHLAPWRGQEEFDREVAAVRARFPTAEAILARNVCATISNSKGRRPSTFNSSTMSQF